MTQASSTIDFEDFKEKFNSRLARFHHSPINMVWAYNLGVKIPIIHDLTQTIEVKLTQNYPVKYIPGLQASLQKWNTLLGKKRKTPLV